ncbi:MAG: ATP-binding cassette domain-containing protein [Pseudomonadota bacterium]
MTGERGTRETVLEVQGLSAGYRGWEVLHGIDLKLFAGETIGILGHNGAGKTTLLRSIAGLVSASQGKVIFRGADMTRASVPARVKKGVVLVPQGRALFAEMSIKENVMLGAFTRTREDASASWQQLSASEQLLSKRPGEVVGRLSGGQQQIVANARGLASRPSVLMVDEPSLGLSGVAVSALIEFLAGLKAAGMTTVLVEQNVGLAVNACDRFAVLKGGSLIGVYEKDALPKEQLWSLF